MYTQNLGGYYFIGFTSFINTFCMCIFILSFIIDGIYFGNLVLSKKIRKDFHPAKITRYKVYVCDIDLYFNQSSATRFSKIILIKTTKYL